MAPICAGCNAIIATRECSRALDKYWHSYHFCCHHCKRSIVNQNFVRFNQNQYCVNCFEFNCCNVCVKCNLVIGIYSADMCYFGRHFHEECLACANCNESLVFKKFIIKCNTPYCPSCYDLQVISNCSRCSELFENCDVRMVWETMQWHLKCFCCFACKKPFGSQYFVVRDREIYCTDCQVGNFASICSNCNQLIADNGISFRNQPVQRECVSCFNCQRIIIDERFDTYNNQIYCIDCIGLLFVKNCNVCNNPIMNFQVGQFLTFDHFNFHNECFFCAHCKMNLMKSGFYVSENKLICPACIRN